MAAFPGGNGLLAVRPVNGLFGLQLVNSRGTHPRHICGYSPSCGVVKGARWSPDGRELALSSVAAGGTVVVYPDGSCLDCDAIAGHAPAFTTDPSVLSLASGGDLVEFGIDGVRRTQMHTGAVADAVWSAQGQLAVVRGGEVFAGSPGHLRSLGSGRDPSWAPGGSHLVLDRGGWVTVVNVGSGSAHRLARGNHPVWSPDGRSIAYTADGLDLSLIPASGGVPRRMGHMRGTVLDWQPVPAKPVTTCAIPPGSTTIANSDTAMVSTESATIPEFGYAAPAYLGCLLSTGRVRLLARYDFQSIDSTSGISQAAVAGSMAALVEEDQDPHYGGSSSEVKVFDLSTGDQVSKFGGEQVSCPDYNGYNCASGMDSLVINDSGFTAVHSTLEQYGSMQQATVTEQIVASDSSGVRVLDTAKSMTPNVMPPQDQLTALALTGDALTWQRAGSPESATLH
jgi:hypothetical protein